MKITININDKTIEHMIKYHNFSSKKDVCCEFLETITNHFKNSNELKDKDIEGDCVINVEGDWVIDLEEIEEIRPKLFS